MIIGGGNYWEATIVTVGLNILTNPDYLYPLPCTILHSAKTLLLNIMVKMLSSIGLLLFMVEGENCWDATLNI